MKYRRYLHWPMAYLVIATVFHASGPEAGAVPNEPHARCLVGETIDDFGSLDLPADITSLRLYSCSIARLESLRTFQNLRELHVRDCRLDDVRPLAWLPNLSHLSLADNEITDVTALAKCRTLAFLDLRRNEIRDVSPLAALCQLSHLDLRSNPLRDNSFEQKVRAIQEANPNARILVGLESHMIRGDDLRRVLAAKARIATFAVEAQWRYFDRFPHLPDVPDDVRAAILLLRRAGDEEYRTDVTVALVRYASDILAKTHTGTLLDSQAPDPLLAEFLTWAPRQEFGGDELITEAIVHWVSRNRERLPSSALLDAHVQRYRQIEIDLERGWIQELGRVDPKRQKALDTDLPVLSLFGVGSGREWLVASSAGHKGSTALRSAPGLSAGEFSLMVTTADIKGPGQIRFWLKTDTANGACFEFGVDGVSVESCRTFGRTDWHEVSCDVDDGEHSFEWTYQKGSLDDPNDNSADAVWVDHVTWTPIGQTVSRPAGQDP